MTQPPAQIPARDAPYAMVLGVRVHTLPLEAILERIQTAACSTAPADRLLISHVNIMGLNLAYELPWLRRFWNETADLVYCDGAGGQLAARWQGQPEPPRNTLADWSWALAERAAQAGFSLYLLGSAPGVAERAATRLQAAHPGLKIGGARHGFFDKTPGGAENEAVLAQINAAAPGVLLVGFGMPLQDRWLMENWERLDARVAISCGAVFEYLSGDLPRGPRWMTEHRLEWLARVLISPRRYSRRYLRDIPLFLVRLLVKPNPDH